MQQSFLEPSKLQRIVLTTLLLATSLLVSCVMRTWKSFLSKRMRKSFLLDVEEHHGGVVGDRQHREPLSMSLTCLHFAGRGELSHCLYPAGHVLVQGR